MYKNELVPEIRFSEFEGDWEESLLGSIATIIMGQSPAGDTYMSNPTSNSHILVQGNSDMVEGEVVPRIWTTQVTKTAIPNDIIFSVRAPVGDVGITRFNVVLGRGVAGIRGNSFVLFYFQLLKNCNFWNSLSTGSTFQSVNSDVLNKLRIFMPVSILEQNKIGLYFEGTNNNITLKQQELTKLKNFKKAMLQKMFPKEGEMIPEIRFEGFEGEWDSVKISELITKGGSGGTPTSTNPAYYNGSIPFLSISDVTKSGGLVTETEKFITNKGLDNSAAYIVPEGSISLAMYASVGKVALLGVDLATSQAFYNMEFSDYNLAEYMYVYLDKIDIENGWSGLISTGTQANLNANKVRNYEVKIPSSKELIEIKDFFMSLNRNIQAKQAEIEKLQQFKNAMLSKMFV